MADQRQLEEAKNHLEEAGLYAYVTGKLEKIRGGSEKAIDPDGITYVIDPFLISLEGQFWVAMLAGPYQATTVIHVSRHLMQTVMAVETFFTLCKQQVVRYREVVETLSKLQYRGIVAMIDASIENPKIIACCTKEVEVKSSYEFMVKNAHLTEGLEIYRIYPHQSSWSIDSANTKNTSFPKVAPELEKVNEILIDFCGCN